MYSNQLDFLLFLDTKSLYTIKWVLKFKVKEREGREYLVGDHPPGKLCRTDGGHFVN